MASYPRLRIRKWQAAVRRTPAARRITPTHPGPPTHLGCRASLGRDAGSWRSLESGGSSGTDPRDPAGPLRFQGVAALPRSMGAVGEPLPAGLKARGSVSTAPAEDSGQEDDQQRDGNERDTRVRAPRIRREGRATKPAALSILQVLRLPEGRWSGKPLSRPGIFGTWGRVPVATRIVVSPVDMVGGGRGYSHL